MEIQVKIQGIHCAGCLNRIDQSLKSIGVIRFDLDFETLIADIITDEEVTQDMVIKAIEKQGYEATIIGESR
ncbi:MAG: hypothetical protein A2Y45_00830 [Tenericutes bacterium GWC2_34_14]|nr:MAG: hypothetical protein A2Z84_02535 [Tenericutes bacterium GWA2_35_7]OHE29443.1 MAG: hypothetical protein A2Y45_00830 [Tenericutes bacterium GWC2_34_14]OHE34539.1 MAG: hypothetical protein A2012_08450 [Tenericutes bacterium GWE2_34_108]OHE35896.1 MAG: hypothetical protein A2Y46_03155 [Tenericutes bacterium GWF1_35_14]OHE39018.1 MAG: hypothetical protein A2Y44_06775 [Tenericutes bacterium GWF2_35_184]OHE42915.1 MAG: hypothetical protein A2221_09460 [Tenericutes bacterium RIFOXYA2_FULL_36_3